MTQFCWKVQGADFITDNAALYIVEGHCVSASFFGLAQGLINEFFKEVFEDRSTVFIKQTRNSFDAAATSQRAEIRFGEGFNVAANCAALFPSRKTSTTANFSSTSECRCGVHSFDFDLVGIMRAL